MLTRIPISFDEFAGITGYEVPTTTHAMHARIVYDFFRSHLEQDELLKPAYEDAEAPTPYLVRIDGRQTKLASLMQCIDMSRPVTRRTLQPTDRFVSYRSRSEKDTRDKPDKHQPPKHWYTFTSTKPESLGLPPGQHHPFYFRPTSSFIALQSTASDVYVDWHTNKVDKMVYRRGGGAQIFVPKPSLQMRQE